ncbi:MAG: response regulator [Terriglobia bacterium]
MSDRAGESVKILIVDDHPVFRYGLRRLLESEPGFTVIGEAADGAQALKLARELAPDIMTLDLAIPQRSGLEVLRELAAQSLPLRAIVLSASIEKTEIAQAVQLGARGIVLKEAATELIVESIRSVLNGRYWVGRETAGDVVQLLHQLLPRKGTAPHRPNFGLSPREIQVVAAISAGYTNKEIARKLSVSEHTVKHHITNIFDELGVSNRMELILFAVSHQLIDES